MSNLFLNEDGLRAYTEEVKEEISKTVGELPEFASEQIAEDYEFSTTGGTNIIFSFNADKYEKVVFTAYVEGSAGASGSMQFDLLNYPDNTSSNGETVMNLAKFSITPVSGRLEEYVEIDCSGLSGSYTVKSSGGGNAAIMFGATGIKTIAKDAENVTDALNYLDAKIGDITKLDSILIQEEWSGKADSSGYIVCCTFDATDLNRIEFDGSMRFEGSGGGMVNFWLCEGTNPTPQVQIGSISEGGTQKEEVGRRFVYDVSAMTGTCSLIATGSLTACVKSLTGYRDVYSNTVSCMNSISNEIISVKSMLGNVTQFSKSEKLADDWEEQVAAAQGTIGGIIDTSKYTKITMTITASSMSARLYLYFLPESAQQVTGYTAIDEVFASYPALHTKEVVIDCSEYNGNYKLMYSANGTVGYRDVVGEAIIADNVSDALRYLLSLHN